MAKEKQKSMKNKIPFINSIQFKLILRSDGLVCIGLAIILVMLAVKISDKAFADFKENANNQLSIVENYINDFYNKLDENINMIATDPAIIKADDTITSYKNSKTKTDMTPSKNGALNRRFLKYLIIMLKIIRKQSMFMPQRKVEDMLYGRKAVLIKNMILPQENGIRMQ